jgi:hypothetical protein
MPGVGCSITSATTVSTTGARGCFTFRAAFLTGARLGLAFATVRCAALATLRAFPRVAEFPLRSFPRFCTFDFFLRLAMIAPGLVGSMPDQKTTSQVPATYSNELSPDFSLSRCRAREVTERKAPRSAGYRSFTAEN